MKSDDRKLDTLLDQLTTPELPEQLRERTLGAAMEALSENRNADVWTQIWENRQFRLAWMGSLALLMAAHIFVTLFLADSESSDRIRLASSIKVTEPELLEIVKLPSLKAPLPSAGFPRLSELNNQDSLTDNQKES